MKCSLCDEEAWVTDAVTDPENSVQGQVAYKRVAFCRLHAKERQSNTSRFELVMPERMVAQMNSRIQRTLEGIPKDQDERFPYQIPEIGYGTHGLRGNTDVWMVRGADNIYECRMGFMIFGTNNADNEVDNPFDDKYMDNYASGRGITREAALRQMLTWLWKQGEALWE